MRLERLRLIAFGSFTGAEIALAPDRLNVVFGSNEAGKSTTLRAIEALLYGFEARTQDDHVHEAARLRVGGALSTKAGARFELARRKGRKDTVLDASKGEPIDDGPLLAMLGGVGREAFRNVHGLDHDRLRAGGQNLLEGDGQVGESLFAASMGVVRLHRVLARLDEEATEIHGKRRGKSLGDVLDAYDRAREQAKVDATSGDTVEEQRRQHEERLREAEELRARKVELEEKRRRLERVRNVWTKLPEHARVTNELEALGEPCAIDPEGREQAERALTIAEPAIARLERELAELDAARGAIELPVVLLAQGEEIERLYKEYGAHVKAASDRADKERQIEELARRARAVAERLGEDADAVDTSEATLKKLRRAHDALLRAETELEAAMSRARSTEPASPESAHEGADLDALDAALASAKDVPQTVARIDAAERERARLDAKARATLPGLGLAADPAAALSLCAPSQEAARAALDAERPALARVSEIEALRERHAARAAEARDELETLRARAPVPSEQDLRDARAGRDALVDRLAKGEAVATELARAIARADGVADAMRAEAATVSKLAALEREAALEEERAREAERALGPARDALARLGDAWAKTWSASGLEPRPPEETIAWLRDLEEARAWCARAVEIDAELAHDRARLAAAQATLEEAARAGAPAAPAMGALALAETLRARRDAIAGDRRAAEGAERARREAAAEAKTARAKLDAAEAAWREVATAAGIGCPPSTSNTDGALADLADLAARRAEIGGLQRRVSDIDRDRQALSVTLATVVRISAPDLDAAKLESIEVLYARLAKARRQRDDAERIDRDSAARRQELAAGRAAAEAARGVLSRLLEAAGVADVPALRAAEGRTLRVLSLRKERAQLDADLAHPGEGPSLDELRAQAAEFPNLEDVRARLEGTEAQLEETSDELERAARSAAALEAGLREYDEPRARAAESAAEAEMHFARAKELAERWLRLQTAQAVLRRAIDRMRAASQTPVIARASELFAAMTLEAYARLEVSVDEHDVPVLLAIRPGGDAVGMAGLSEGTRDQLFLALRIASLERVAKDGDPLPLVLDDVLVDFDDERARAALVVLARLAPSMQVLLFTHHARIVELAREAVSDVEIAVLPSARVAPAA